MGLSTSIMKNKILVILFLVFGVNALKAEYNGWYIQFEITTKANTSIVGWTYVAEAYFNKDSIHNSNYLIERFDVLDHQKQGTINFYHHLLTYRFKSFAGDDEKIYTLIEEDSIPVNEIKSMQVLKMHEFWYLQGVVSKHQISDTTWMKSPVLERITVGGELCTWDIFVHQKSEAVEKLKAALSIIENKYTQKIEALEEELDYAEGDHEKLEDEIDNLLEQKEDDIFKKIKNFELKKTVIISFCSC